jgi:hypothetical protein
MLNAGDEDVQVTIRLFFTDREPAGPYRVVIPARRTLHLRLNVLQEREPVARDTEYASVIEFDGAARCAAVSASWSPWGRASGSVSGALDGSGGEGVEVVGQQPPPDPCSCAVVTPEP